MAEEIVFHHNPQSRAAIAHRMLEEVGPPYRVIPGDLQTGDNRTPEFLRINRMGEIPVIQHRGVTVTEAPAILAYLADTFRQAGLAPSPTVPERGAYRRANPGG